MYVLINLNRTIEITKQLIETQLEKFYYKNYV